MNEPKKKPIAQEAYDIMAESYAAKVDTKPHNAYYERPATLSLLPDVMGKRVLDAGCGPGVYSKWLVDHGAEVLALDANENMVRLARERLGDRVQVIHADLEQPLDFLAECSFDIVVSPLVMDYIMNWDMLFQQFHRVLREQGHLIFSMEHPYVKYYDHCQNGNYHKIELVEYDWYGFDHVVRVPSYRRSLSAVINPLIKAGFILEQILEPLPTEQFKQFDPEGYEELMRSPGFMCVRAVKA
jgi:SAM-dependent methyltransferase